MLELQSATDLMVTFVVYLEHVRGPEIDVDEAPQKHVDLRQAYFCISLPFER